MAPRPHPTGAPRRGAKRSLLGAAAVAVVAASLVTAKKSSDSSGDNGGAPTSTIDDTNLWDLANSHAQAGKADSVFYGSTDLYGNPIFLNSFDPAAPTHQDAPVQCKDNATGLSLQNLREHPRLMVPGYQWDCVSKRIAKDAYLTLMNESVFANASAWYDMPPTNYSIDGGYTGSGILDVSREVQRRVRAWAYAYRITGDHKWVNRTWTELHVAAGNTSQPFGQGPPPLPDQHWNPQHFLDTGEMTAAFAIGYDWLYDAWTPEQREALRWSIITLGLTPGLESYNGNATIGWWTQSSNGGGNWNCVCNSGLILAALAISGDDGDDPQKTSSQVLSKGMENLRNNCFQAPFSDGTWPETPNYWYFGTNAAARVESALVTATGSNQNLNTEFYKTGLFHIYVSGQSGMFAYGDHGPNKFSTNANGMLWWGKQYNQTLYSLFQRDRADALGDPLALFWYDETVKGAFWNNMPLDHFFDDPRGSWVSMRSSWTNWNGTYLAMKASNLTGHQTHGDLDVGDFVFDAMGTRWAGEYGSAQYLSDGYFSSEAETSERWTYYRKMTQGQNSILVDGDNQQVNCAPENKFDSSNVTQSASVNYAPGVNDTAYFTTDMSSAYNQSSGAIQRGIRFLNARRQMLLQDEIKSGVAKKSLSWHVQTNATVKVQGNSAILTISDLANPNAATTELFYTFPEKTLNITILSPSDATFKTEGPPAGNTGVYANNFGDPVNTNVTLLTIDLPTTQDVNLQTWWQPQWDNLGAGDTTTPPSVPLAQWSVDSHNNIANATSPWGDNGGVEASSAGSPTKGSGENSAGTNTKPAGAALGFVALVGLWWVL